MTNKLAETKHNTQNILSIYGLLISGTLIGMPAGFDFAIDLLGLGISGLIIGSISGIHLFKNLEWDREEDE